MPIQYRMTLVVKYKYLSWVDFGLDFPSSCPVSSLLCHLPKQNLADGGGNMLLLQVVG